MNHSGRSTILDVYDAQVLPAVCERLDQVFPEFGWQRRGSRWQATIVPDTIGVGDAKRIECKGSAGRPMPGFVVHGAMNANCWLFTEYVLGRDAGTGVRGEDFRRAVGELASRAGVGLALEGLDADSPEARAQREQLAREAEAKRAASQRREQLETKRKMALAGRIWRGATPDNGPALAYLHGRGLDSLEQLPPTVRCHEALEPPVQQSGACEPGVAMVCAVTVGDPPRLIGVHCTYLEPAEDGWLKRRDLDNAKAMFGRVAGGAVRLAPLDGSGELVLCEGIETGFALLLSQERPVWACLSTAGLKSIRLPEGITRVTIAADLDASGAGLEAAEQLAKRLAKEQIETRLAIATHEVVPQLVSADGEVMG